MYSPPLFEVLCLMRYHRLCLQFLPSAKDELLVFLNKAMAQIVGECYPETIDKDVFVTLPDLQKQELCEYFLLAFELKIIPPQFRVLDALFFT